MKPEALTTELSSDHVRPAYLLAGEETLFRDDALRAIRGVVLSTGPEDFNFERLDADKTSPGRLSEAVRALPVMANRRLVVLQGADARGAKALTDALSDVVAEVSAQDQTVLVVTAARASRASRWVKSFRDPAAVVECEPPKGVRALLACIRKEAASQEVSLGRGAAELLAERIGPQLLLLRQEIAKAALLAGMDAQVTRAHVEVSTTQAAEVPIWDLTDAIGEGRPADAVVTLARMLGAGAPPPVLLGSLASHFRRLVRARSGVVVPGPPFVVKKLERQSRRYTPGRLLACLNAIHQADTALKGAGSLGPSLALERLVIGLAS